jgi:shikimate dehydrogenase
MNYPPIIPFRFDADTQLCAVIGNPVAHSLSPAMHNAAFQATGLNYVYLAFAVSDLAGCMAGMRAMKGFRGMSVTIPHKVAVINHLDEVMPQAREVGCVNTIVNESGKLIGAITDGLGTLRAFERAGVSLDGKAILFVGTGGAARAVAFAMAGSRSPALIRVLGRTAARVKELTDDLRLVSKVPIYSGNLDDICNNEAAAHDIIVHATPVGMYGHSEGESSIPQEWLHSGQVVFDMVYRPRETKLMEYAAKAHCQIIPGLEMLLHQAAIQFEMWTKQPAPESIMRNALIEALQPGIT